MSSRLDHERIEELLAAKSLDGLEPADVAELERLQASHGPRCEECRRLEDELAEVAGRLAFADAPAEVPASFEDRLVAAATVPERRGSHRARRWGALAAAAAVLVVAGGFGGYLLRSPGTTGVEIQGARITRLHGTGQGNVALAYVPKSQQWFLVGANLPDAPTGKVYELWLFHGKTPAPAGTFTPQNGVALLNVPSAASTANLAAITIEEAPGAQQPTTQPIFAGSV